MANWIQNAVNPANKGKFTAQANKAGKSVAEEAKSVLKPNSKASTTTKRRAVFAENMAEIGHKRLAEKAKA
jgi:hypothetical protein